MKAANPSSPTPVGGRAVWLAVVAIALLTIGAYHRSFSGEMIFDDASAIVENPTIRHLWPLGSVLLPPSEGGDTVGGRPLLNFSLALNYALGGTAVQGYHVFNLLLHLGAALALFGVVRRTLLLPQWHGAMHRAAAPLGAGVALLWALHPLQTESVAYIVQRAEVMMGLFYLLTLYAFVRGATATRPTRWWLLAWLACVGGMATKEVMITAPVMVFLFDRTFIAGSFARAWRERRGIHLSLAATWILLGLLIASTGGNRGGTKGFGLGFAWWEFPLTQFQAVAHYLKLSLWPHPLAFEYERFWVTSFGQLLPSLLVVGLLALGSLVALWRWPIAGFLGVWFFGILAPSSLAPGASQMIAEHRLYLPLAAIISLFVWIVWRLLRLRTVTLAVLVVFALTILTLQRVEDYRTAVTLWSDTVAKRPLNGVAHGQLALALAAEGQLDRALPHYEEAIRLERSAEPEGQRGLLAEITVNYGNALLAAGRADEAIAAYTDALRHDASQKLALFNLGSVSLQQGKLREAGDFLRSALQLAPDDAPAHTNLASALLREGKTAEALGHYETALRLQPDSARAEANVGNACLILQRIPEAIAHLQRAVQLDPELAPAHEFLGDALVLAGRRQDAAACYDAALRLEPANPDLRRKRERLTR